jgi:hypothetical protein
MRARKLTVEEVGPMTGDLSEPAHGAAQEAYEAAARLYEQAAAELDQAAAHCRVAADRLGFPADRLQGPLKGVVVVPCQPVRALVDAAGPLLAVDDEHPGGADHQVDAPYL